jgi:thiamine pyrophosphokinase
VDDRLFKSWAAASHILVAADGGADLALRHGIVVHAIIGDLDSVSQASLDSGADIYKFDDPNTTDCDKLLAWVEAQGHDAIDLIGVEGDRLDHVLATLGSCAKSRLKIRLVLREGLGYVLRSGSHRLETAVGDRLSLVPIVDSTGVTASNVQWPFDQANMSLTGFVSVSNVALDNEVEISLESGALLVVIEHDGTILEA